MTGSGTLLDPYVIWDLNDLRDVRLYDAAYFELGADIDASPAAGWFGGLGFEPLDWPYPQKRQPTGDHSSVGNWTVFPVVPGTKWDKVNEVDQDGDATYIRIDALGGEVLFTSPNFNIPAGSTNITLLMEVISRIEGVAPPDAEGKIFIRVNGTNYESASWRELSDQAAYEYSNMQSISNNPDTGLPWTVDDINGVGPNPLQAWGIKVKDQICRITKIVALVTCDPLVNLTFDGRGHTIRNLTINRSVAGPYDIGDIALFRWLDGGEIKNINIINCNITGRWNVGGIVGGVYWASGGISNCNVLGTLESLQGELGGIVGFAGYANGNITNCHFTGTLTCPPGSIGGIAGYAWVLPAGAPRLKIENCSFNGQISSLTGDADGGIAGYASEYDLISCTVKVSITGEAYLGGLVGEMYDTNINDCSAEIEIIGLGAGWDREIGGLVGVSWGTGFVISRSKASGSINSPTSRYVGGLVGYSNNRIEQSRANVDIVADRNVGGLVGISYASVQNSYSLGDVNGASSEVGGLIGQQNQLGSVVEKSYSAGLVIGGGPNVGGLVGLLSFGTINNDCFWDIETSLQTLSAGGIGKTTAEMKVLATFLAAGWDIETISSADLADGYPFLSWQIPGSSPIWYLFWAPPGPPPKPAVVTLPATEVR